MNWTELLTSEMENSYRAADKLMDLVDEASLDWKPATGANWMTTGQLLKHITEACGKCFQGFVTGDWGFNDMGESEAEAALPSADAMATVSSVREAKDLLAKDKALAVAMLAQAGEDGLANRKVSAPWDPTERILGQQLLGMVAHLECHKNQLYYYLKLQGQPVNTFHMYGMA